MSEESRADLLDNLFDAVEAAGPRLDPFLAPKCFELSKVTQRYSEPQLLGQGGLKVVYSVYDAKTARRVALAEPRSGLHPVFYDLIVREAQLTSQLSHPNIIKTFDLTIDRDQRPYFTMDLKRGHSLRAWLSHAPSQKKLDRFALDDRLVAFNKVCHAVAYAHETGVIHGDIKPDNIQIEAHGEVVLCDWGLGRPVGEEYPVLSEGKLSLNGNTIHGFCQGTPSYCPPEQLEKGALLDCRSDVYALGALLYFMLCGFDPPACDDVFSTKSLKVKHVPKNLVRIIQNAMAAERHHRYASVQELQEDVRAYRRHLPTSHESRKPFRKIWLCYLRNHLLCNAVALGAVLGLLGTVYASNQLRKAAEESERLERQAKLALGVAAETQDELDDIDRALREVSAIGGREASLLSQQMAKNTIPLMRKLAYTNPLEVENALGGLIRLNLTLNPYSALAWHQTAAVKTYQLDTAAAKAIANQHQIQKYGLPDFLANLPELDYNSNKRPSLDELVSLFQNLKKKRRMLPASDLVLFERILSYDYAHRMASIEGATHVPGYEQVVKAYYSFLFSERDNWTFEYDPESKRLIFGGESVNPVNVDPPEGSGLTPLRFMPVKHLVLFGSGSPSLGRFVGCELETVDMHRVEDMSLSGYDQFPNLKELILASDQVLPDSWEAKDLPFRVQYR